MSRFKLTDEDSGTIFETDDLKDIENAVFGEEKSPIKIAVTILIVLFIILFVLLMVTA